MRKYGINVISLWPWSIVFGLEWCIKLAVQAGFDGVQISPMKRWKKYYKNLSPWADKIIAYEDAWGVPPYDWFLFGGYPLPLILFAIKCIHNFLEIGPKFVTEIRSEVSKFCQDYVDFSGGLCWDTFHVLSLDCDWRILLEKLPFGKIKLVHIHMQVPCNINIFFSQLEEMLGLLRQKIDPDTPVILELNPLALLLLLFDVFGEGVEEYLGKILEETKELI